MQVMNENRKTPADWPGFIVWYNFRTSTFNSARPTVPIWITTAWYTFWNWGKHFLAMTIKHLEKIFVATLYFSWVIVILLALAHFGFRKWTIQEAIDAVTAFSWPHAIVAASAIAVFVFRENLAAFIDRIKSVGLSSKGFDVQTAEREVAKFVGGETPPAAPVGSIAQTAGPSTEVPAVGSNPAVSPPPESPTVATVKVDSLITIDDVAKAFDLIPHLDKGTIEKEKVVAHFWLLRNGITTRELLQVFVSSTAVFDTLANIYRQVLKRNKDTPLDAVAISTWGAAIFRLGIRDDVLQAVTAQIMQSSEYKKLLST